MDRNKNNIKEKKQHVKNNSQIQKWLEKEKNVPNDFTENSGRKRKRRGKTVKKLPGKSTTPKIRNQGKKSRNKQGKTPRNKQGKNNVILREMPIFPYT